MGVLINPMNPAADLQLRKLQEAAAVIKRQLDIVRASTAHEIETAFEIAAQAGLTDFLWSKTRSTIADAIRSWHWLRAIDDPQSIHYANLPISAGLLVTDMTL